MQTSFRPTFGQCVAAPTSRRVFCASSHNPPGLDAVVALCQLEAMSTISLLEDRLDEATKELKWAQSRLSEVQTIYDIKLEQVTAIGLRLQQARQSLLDASIIAQSDNNCLQSLEAHQPVWLDPALNSSQPSQSCRLSDLPPEVRNQIYRYVVVTAAPINVPVDDPDVHATLTIEKGCTYGRLGRTCSCMQADSFRSTVLVLGGQCVPPW